MALREETEKPQADQPAHPENRRITSVNGQGVVGTANQVAQFMLNQKIQNLRAKADSLEALRKQLPQELNEQAANGLIELLTGGKY